MSPAKKSKSRAKKAKGSHARETYENLGGTSRTGPRLTWGRKLRSSAAKKGGGPGDLASAFFWRDNKWCYSYSHDSHVGAQLHFKAGNKLHALTATTDGRRPSEMALRQKYRQVKKLRRRLSC